MGLRGGRDVKAISMKEPRKLEILDCSVPAAGPDEVRVRVAVAGICASDRHAYSGVSFAARYPFVMGRNVAGEIVALGGGVTNLALGDRVAVDPVWVCGKCEPCRAGDENLCEALQVMGIHRDGGMAEYVTVPARNAHTVPKDWPWERIVMVEPFAIVANVLSRVRCTERDVVLVVGAGAVGLSVLMAARHLGARVAVADVLEARLDMALKRGADFTLNMNDDAFQEKLLRWSGGRGISLSVDVVCLADFFPLLQKLAASRGRVAHLGFSEKPLALIPAEVNRKELSIVGARLGCGMFPQVIAWFSSGAFAPENLVSHTFPYTEAQEAFMLIEESPVNVARVLLTF